MRPAGLTALLCAIAVTALALPAEAAPRKKVYARSASQNTVFVSRDENGRTRTRIIVTPRSYLDGGTEVRPASASSPTTPSRRTGRRSTSLAPARTTTANRSIRSGSRAGTAAGFERATHRMKKRGRMAALFLD